MSQTPAPDQDPSGTTPEDSAEDAPPTASSFEEQATMAADTAGLAESAGGERDDPLLGQLIADRYEIQRLLGEGGMGAVYLAEHVMMQKPVALKVLHPELSQHDEIVARFQREARAAAAINHPNICAATDFGRLPDGASFLVMEYLQGRTLEDVIRAHGRLGTARAVHITDQICSVLSMAHAKGIVHRDLKPENIMLVTWDGDADVVKVMDFGIASMRPGGGDESEEDPAQSRLTRAGVAYGTPTYMSPEQVAGAPDIDGRADLYTLGAILFEMLTGRPPFQGSSITRLMSQHLTAPIPSAREVAPEGRIPPQLDAVLERMLAKEREDRYASADELREALGQLALPEPDPAAPSPAPQLARANRAPAAAVPAITAARTRFDALPQHFKLATLAVPMLAGLVVLAAILAIAIGASDGPPTPTKDDATPEQVETRQIRKSLATAREDFVDDTTGMRAALEKMAAGEASGVATELEGRATELGSSPHFHYYLGMARRADEDLRGALASFERAVELDARYARDETLQAAVVDGLVAKKDELREAATSLASRDEIAPHLGAPLAEIAQSGERGAHDRALEALKAQEIFDELPPWRQGAIELRHASGCKEHASAIAALKASEDPRALGPLRRLSKKPRRGCGFLRNKDCYACVRNDIAQAIEALEAKKKPGDDESKEEQEGDDD